MIPMSTSDCMSTLNLGEDLVNKYVLKMRSHEVSWIRDVYLGHASLRPCSAFGDGLELRQPTNCWMFSTTWNEYQ